jgi:hypothetical protein
VTFALRTVTLMLVALVGSPVFADDEAEPLRWGGQAFAGLPQRLVVPEYPAEALDRRITGYVDVEGVVDGARRLADPVLRPGSPEAEVFVPALRKVVPDWVFYPRYGKGSCVPVPTQMHLRVTFALEQDKPRIATDPPVPPAPSPGRSRPHCDNIRYPSDALRNDETAIVYARVNVGPDGITSSVESEVYPKHEAFIDDGFKDAVKSALSYCRFDRADYPTPPHAACFDVVFNLGRDHSH